MSAQVSELEKMPDKKKEKHETLICKQRLF
jgi:hypothetical protein